MNKRLRFLSRSVLAAAAVVPAALAANNVQAQDYGYNYNYYQPGYNYWDNGYGRYSNYGYNNYNYGYNNYNYGYNYNNWNYGYNNYNNWNYGYNNWNNGWNNGYNNNYNNLSNDSNYTYWNGNHYYRMSDGSYRVYRNGQWVPLSNASSSNGYNSLVNDPNYTYWNGSHYYRMSDGSYRIYRDGQWLPLNNNNNNSGTNNLENDSHYRYENGYHYYVLDNGDYYYYQNGQWVFVKASSDNTNPEVPTPTPNPEPTPETPVPDEKPKPETPTEPSTPETPKPETPTEPSTPETPKPETPTEPSTPETPKPETPTEPSTPETPNPDTPGTIPTPQPDGGNGDNKPNFNGTGESAVDPNYDRTGTALDPNIKPDLTNEYSTDLQPIPDVLDKGPSEADYNNPNYRYENGHHYYHFDDGKVYIYDTTTGKWKYVRTVPKEDGTKPSLETTDKPSESLIPEYTEKPAENLEELDWAPKPPEWTSIPKPPGKPGDPELEKDPNYVYDKDTDKHYYLLNTNAEVDGIDSYYEWWGTHWKLKGMGVTDPNDPAIDPEIHKESKTEEYMFDDDKSSHKLWSENVIATGEAGKPLPFKTLSEFRAYVQKVAQPKLVDNAGYDVKVTYKLDEQEKYYLNEATQNGVARARDYVLTATIRSSVKGYEKTEFGDIKFIYRVQPNEQSNYPNLDKAKAAFARINELRKAEGLKELTWSDSLYNEQSLPAANKLGIKYEDTGINFRREEDPVKVANRWVNSGYSDFLLDPNATEGAVAAIQNDQGTYYWVFNSK